jgi:hypothetical protein
MSKNLRFCNITPFLHHILPKGSLEGRWGNQSIPAANNELAKDNMTTANTFDPSHWLANHTNVTSYNIDELHPAMWFALIWNRFELKVCDREASIPTIEKSLKTASDSGLLDWKEFEEFWTTLNAYLAKEGALSNLDFFLLSDKKPNKKEQEYVKILLPILQGDRPDIEIGLRAMLFIAYRVRNNLFHGEKCVTKLPRQHDLFLVLNSFIAKYIDVTTNAQNG